MTRCATVPASGPDGTRTRPRRSSTPPRSRGADTVPARSRGYDAGKRVNGRKRHLAVDTGGLLLTVVVTIAGIQDCDGAVRLRAALRAEFSTDRPDLGRRRPRRTPGALGADGARAHRQHRQAHR